MRTILSATLALALLSLTAAASAQYNDSRDRRSDRNNNDRYSTDRYSNDRYNNDRYNNDRYNRDSSYRSSSSAERQRNAIWRDLFARQEDERREFYRCTPYRRGSREYCRALDRIVQRQEQERAEMRDRLSRDSRSYRDDGSYRDSGYGRDR